MPGLNHTFSIHLNINLALFQIVMYSVNPIVHRFKRSYFLGLFISFLLIQSCKYVIKTEVVPANLIPQDQFVEFLVDLSMTEAAANANVMKVPNLQIDSIYAFDLLKERKIRKTQYDSTLLYYSDHIEEYKKVYEKVIETLSTLEVKRRGHIRDSSSK